MIRSTFSGDGLCSMAKVDRWSNIDVDVSRSASYPSRRLSTCDSLYMALTPCQGTEAWALEPSTWNSTCSRPFSPTPSR